MKKPILGALLLSTLAAASAQAQNPQLLYDSAYFAWQHGNYPDALAKLKRVLRGPEAARFLEPAALLTGEWYSSTEIAPPDRYVVNVMAGNTPRWSPDGRYFGFETGTAANPMVHIYRWENGRAEQAAPFAGSNLAFSNDSRRAAYVRGDEVIERDLASGTETIIRAGGVGRGSLVYSSNILYMSAAKEGAPAQVYRISGTDEAIPVSAGGEAKRVVAAMSAGRILATAGNNAFTLIEPNSTTGRILPGVAGGSDADGNALVYLTRAENVASITLLPAMSSQPVVLKTGAQLSNPVLSPDGKRVVFQQMLREDWELFVIDADGKNERRITREIQHDHTPRFLTNDLVLGVMGENRHRRSYVYDLNTGTRRRLFHNNQIRTVSMEYAWSPSPDGTKVIIVADRDGNTITPERGVYVLDLTRQISTGDLLARIERMAAEEQELRERGRAMFAALAPQVRQVVAQADVSRVYAYEKALFEFDSKFITQPGNMKAAEYIFNTLKSFGYEPVYQYFEPRPGVRTANVLARLEGTRDPHLLYVVSSHFDSVERGPGADDDSSGSAALLEAARIMAGRRMPTTIVFAWFTGEEGGLLGSRHYIRQAVADKLQIIGALNNDMVGFANDERLDNTIRYSNVGLRDLQHAAAFLFTNLITYDSKYYQSTDAAAYFEAYGDIVGGIGSYPILGNPHYHQPHDVLETINHQLVTEVAKTTAASLMLMTSAPARLKSVTATATATGAQVEWSAAPETNVRSYVVAYGPGATPAKQLRVRASTKTVLPGVKAGEQVWVKAVNAQGLEGWDWARVVVK